MSRFIFALLWTIASGTAFAALTWAGESAGYTAYADLDTLRVSGSTAIMWDTLDGKGVGTIRKLRGATYRSQRTQMEYDCKGRRSRRLYYAAYSGPMAGGAIVYSSLGPFQWEAVAPGSVPAAMLDIACREHTG
jgi:hypothetical protein